MEHKGKWTGISPHLPNTTLFLAPQVTQYNCDYDNLAPQGCTQYFFGSDTGILKTYNFDGGLHLANQDQAICIRYNEMLPSKRRRKKAGLVKSSSDVSAETAGRASAPPPQPTTTSQVNNFFPISLMQSINDCLNHALQVQQPYHN